MATATRTKTAEQQQEDLLAEAALLVAAYAQRSEAAKDGFFHWLRIEFDRLDDYGFYKYGPFITKLDPKLRTARQTLANMSTAYAARIIPVTRELAVLRATYPHLDKIAVSLPAHPAELPSLDTYSVRSSTARGRLRPIKVSRDPRKDMTLADELDGALARYRWHKSQDATAITEARDAAWDRLMRELDYDLQSAEFEALLAADSDMDDLLVDVQDALDEIEAIEALDTVDEELDPDERPQKGSVSQRSGRLFVDNRKGRKRRKVQRSVTFWRRVLHPEDSKSGPCVLCELASEIYYKVSDLQPIHDNCKCKAVPVIDGVSVAPALNTSVNT